MARTQIIELPETAPVTPAPRRESPPVQCTDVYVVFTSVDDTLAALRVASGLARSMNGHLRLVHFRVVQVGAPVEAPTGRSPIEADGFLQRLKAEGIETEMDVYVCRDARRAIPLVFKDHSLIVIGGRHHRWPTRAERWRRLLEHRGHFVLFVDGANGRGTAGKGVGACGGAEAGEGAGAGRDPDDR